MSSAYAYIQRLRLLAVAENPRRLIMFRRTYLHPTSRQRVTLQPIPPFARPQFWDETCSGLHQGFDRIIFQDGRQPLQAPASAFRAALKKFFPYVAYRDVVDRRELQAYIGNPTANPKETQMAYYSTSKLLDPPVDPRARKAMELLQSVDPKLHVIIPWHFIHMPYFAWKLTSLGYLEESSKGSTVALHSDVIFLSVLFVFSFIILPLYLILKN